MRKLIAFILALLTCMNIFITPAFAKEDESEDVVVSGETAAAQFKTDKGIGGAYAIPSGSGNMFCTDREASEKFSKFGFTEVTVDYACLTAGVSKKGKIETAKFMDAGNVQREVGVYLPYGYDASDKTKAYNVLVIFQGLAPSIDSTRTLKSNSAVMDYVISNKLAEPFIVFDCPEEYVKYDGRAKNVVEGLMSFAKESYNVYGAQDLMPADDVRNHYALMGFSSGASVVCGHVAAYKDMFASFGICSFQSSAGFQEDVIKSLASKKYPLKNLFLSAGDKAGGYSHEDRSASGAVARYNTSGKNENIEYRECFLYNGYQHGDSKIGNASIARFVSLCFGGAKTDLLPPSEQPATGLDIAETPTWPQGTVSLDQISFSSDSEKLAKHFAEQYGWDFDKLNAAVWEGKDGKTYARPQGYEAESFLDAWQTDIELCIELGILDERSAFSGSGTSIVEIALAEVGTTEDYPESNTTKYNRWYYGKNEAAAWCAIFVSWCAYKAGLLEGTSNCVHPIFQKTAGVKGHFNYLTETMNFQHYPGRSITQLGGAGYTAKLGDIFCFYDKEKRCLGHIGIVTKVGSDFFEVTQGNTGNGKNDAVKTFRYTAKNISDPKDLWVSNGEIIAMKYPYAYAGTVTGIGASTLSTDQQKLLDTCYEVLKDPSLLGKVGSGKGYYMGCAAFVQGVYNRAGFSAYPGNGYTYWQEYSSSGSTDLSRIPIGALISGPHPSPWGHVGIYVGNGMVLHYTSGKVCLWPLYKIEEYKSEDRVAFIKANSVNGWNNSFIGWADIRGGNGGWCWPKNMSLGDAADYTNPSAKKNVEKGSE